VIWSRRLSPLDSRGRVAGRLGARGAQGQEGLLWGAQQFDAIKLVLIGNEELIDSFN